MVPAAAEVETAADEGLLLVTSKAFHEEVELRLTMRLVRFPELIGRVEQFLMSRGQAVPKRLILRAQR